MRATSLLELEFRIPLPPDAELIGRVIRERELLIQNTDELVVTGEYNVLLNPAHAEFEKIEVIAVQSFSFDRRLYGEALKGT